MNQLSDDAARGARERDAGERTGKNISDTADRVAKQLDALQKLKTLGSVWLSTCDVTGNPPGEPRIPSYCDGNKECTQCYSQARSDFNQTRATLEKRSEEHTSELQSLMRISYAVLCLKKKN